MPEPRPTRLVLACALLGSVLAARPSLAHDIPNARVDRSIQVTLQPGRLEIAYEVSLSELTLTQELRSLVGTLPGADRSAWFDAYGRETAGMNAKGLLVWAGGEPIDLAPDGFDLVVEDHPRYTFRFVARLPEAGRLRVRDTNFASSEGTSRLAVKGVGVFVRGDDLPADVASIPARPVWQLTDAEERRTHDVRVEYQPADERVSARSPVAVAERSLERRPPIAGETGPSLSRLLDKRSQVPVGWLALIAFALGAAHAFQPGHGKTLVATTVLSEGGNWTAGGLLGVVSTLSHAGSVVLIAALLWWSGSARVAGIHQALTRSSGFLIGAVGLWRVGRLVAGFSLDHHAGDADGQVPGGLRGRVIGLGMAGGFVPCWDAVGLVLLAAAVGRLGLGLVLVSAFSSGMGLVLIAFGWVVARLRGSFRSSTTWERRIGLASGWTLFALGVYLLSA